MKGLPGLKADTMSSVRVNKARNLLRRVLDRAVKKGWLSANPVEEVPRLREDPAIIDPMSWNEVQLLFDKGSSTDPKCRPLTPARMFTAPPTTTSTGPK